MKKTLILIALLVCAYSCKAQTNKLTEEEITNIKFNNISLKQIIDSRGSIADMRALFSNELNTVLNETAPFLSRDFWSNSIYLNFEDESDTGNQYRLTNIQIKDSLIGVTVKGITIKLGDNVSVFGNDILINTNNNDNSIVFVDELTGSAALAFKIDTSNNIIEIEFSSY